ncbi:hypothetical protein EJ03DRAFT_332780 [Teratosphaeria nubilosa]|uniref:Uncharacterized protein n=1 Tax=Teratosphaeria nubilosa TaxID=161662 RepID=A0A6G1LNZ4_9PEZI|nr:hypothetical protein EJ03DRAFT_332780 [Teratosphaeria nubilosa]
MPTYEEPFPHCRCRGPIPPGLSQGPDVPDITRIACQHFSAGTYRNGSQEYVSYNEEKKECNPNPVGIEPSYWDEAWIPAQHLSLPPASSLRPFNNIPIEHLPRKSPQIPQPYTGICAKPASYPTRPNVAISPQPAPRQGHFVRYLAYP